jgi:hypothetical protein
MPRFIITHIVDAPDAVTLRDMRSWLPKVVRPSEWPKIVKATVEQSHPETRV